MAVFGDNYIVSLIVGFVAKQDVALAVLLGAVSRTFRSVIQPEWRAIIQSVRDSVCLWDVSGTGSMSLMKRAIKKGATDFNGGLWRACTGGHREIVELMIEKGATNWDHCEECEKSHKQVISRTE